ncbi:hypothetical protein LIA77_05328 [Sarocladium implicatum]|nr:hypothetical protein LIA77_05328 [Sarocladium implicatum]
MDYVWLNILGMRVSGGWTLACVKLPISQCQNTSSSTPSILGKFQPGGTCVQLPSLSPRCSNCIGVLQDQTSPSFERLDLMNPSSPSTPVICSVYLNCYKRVIAVFISVMLAPFRPSVE